MPTKSSSIAALARYARCSKKAISAPLLSISEMAAELNGAISAAHASHLVHRDIKPDNVLVRSRVPLQLILIDFGIASILDATQRFTGAARTLMYASPESLSGVIDGKTDYWALGMVLLEAATGHHPFTGLSDAVILHHLATRNIDLQNVAEPGTRKLLKGLLLRDPQKRWGSSEVSRWLQGDVSLAEPADVAVALHFAEPYHLGDQQCHTAEQLAVALAAHWKEGVADLNNGQLLSWFSNVQKDQNTVRLLLDFQQDARLPGDVRLLQLLLHLYPALAPVWRGESAELPPFSSTSLALYRASKTQSTGFRIFMSAVYLRHMPKREIQNCDWSISVGAMALPHLRMRGRRRS